MRYFLIGLAFVAAVACIYLAVDYFPSQALGSTGPLVAVTALLIGLLVWRFVVRHRRLRDWASATGRIESCMPGAVDEGMQSYQCSYIFWVDDARQGGSFEVFDKRGRLEEIRAGLIGESVTVRYNPSDCTQSIVEGSQIKGWNIS